MTRTITVEGRITSVNTASALVSQGSITTANRRPRTGATKILQINAVASVDVAAAGAGSIILRLVGGVQNGPHTFGIASFGGQAVQGGADPSGVLHAGSLFDVDIFLTGDNLEVEFEQVGSDLGDADLCVTFTTN